MVFYFSGTGNSQLVAKQVAQTLGDELVSVNECLKAGGEDTFRSEKPLVFVAPIYAWRLPRVVEGWMRGTRFQGCRDAYFILTCGGGPGNAGAYVEKLCREIGLEFRGSAGVRMPENYMAMFTVPGEEECRAIRARAEPQVAALAELIRAGKPFDRSVSLAGRLLSGPVNLLYYPLFIRDKGFSLSDACVSCGKCARRCPLNNIELVEGKPRWRGNCTHCMACIGGCPVRAIEYKTNSQGKRQYYIMED